MKREVWRHAALSLHAATERDGHEVTFQVIRPLMVWTHEFGGVANWGLAELHATVGTPVDEAVESALKVTRDDDGTVAYCASHEVTRVWHFAAERYVAPATTVEDAFLFERVDFWVRVQPVGNSRHALGGPRCYFHLTLSRTHGGLPPESVVSSLNPLDPFPRSMARLMMHVPPGNAHRLQRYAASRNRGERGAQSGDAPRRYRGRG